MDLATIVTDGGAINISRTTIETLIQLVLLDIDGINNPRKKRFSKVVQKENLDSVDTVKHIGQDIKVEIKDDSILVNLFLFIKYGIRIPDLTWEVQSRVKEKIKEVTGIDIEQINVHIQGIVFSKKPHNKRSIVNPGSFLKIF